MTDELREASIIGLELIVFGVIVLIILTFGNFAERAFFLKNLEDASRMEITEYKNFYEFTHGKEEDIDELRKIDIKRTTSGLFTAELDEEFARIHGSEVTGDDILRFIGLYAFEYDVIVYTNSFDLALTTDSHPDGWSLTELSDKFKEKMGNTFYCFAVYDTYNHMYDSIVFYEKST